jgi:arylsulfatase A-like enzyme
VAALAAALVPAAACSSSERPRDLRLLERLAPEAAPGAAVSRRVWTIDGPVGIGLVAPQRVRVGGSDRDVRVTGRGIAWRIDLPEEGVDGAVVELSAAALGPLGSPGSRRPSRVEVQLSPQSAGGSPAAGAERRILLAWDLRPGDLWVRKRVVLPPGSAGGTLRLASAGRWPVAWSEVYLDAGAEGGEDPRPDIVLVVIDTLRADHLSAYGYRRPTSPRLDRLAGQGTLFLRSLSAATWTLPSTASLLTGLPPDRHGARTGDDTLGETAVTLAEELRDLGYRTAAITDGGFVDPQWGFGQGFDRYETTERRDRGQQRVRQGAAAALRFLEENRHAPFFLLLHTYEPHQPYFNREGFGDPFLAEIGKEQGSAANLPHLDGGAELASARAGGEPGEAVEVGPDVRLDGLGLARAVALYDGEIRRVDHYFGQVLDRLESRSGRTAVLVTSDHGEEFQEHGGLDHFAGKLFEENVRVPLILRAPQASNTAAGRRIAAPVSGIDVMPTLLALAGAPERARRLPGRNLLEIAAGEPGAPGSPPRSLLVQGLSTPAVPRAVRYRLDHLDRSLVFDALRGSASGYDRAADPGMSRPGPAPAGLAERLQAALAESSGGQLAVRLPAAVAAVEVPAGSRIVPIGLWDGLAWRAWSAAHPSRPAAGSRPAPPTVSRLAVIPGLPHCLVFRLGPGAGDLDLRLVRPDGRVEAVRPVPLREAPASVLDGLPPPLAAFRSAAPLRPGRARPTPEAEAELRALGYLR